MRIKFACLAVLVFAAVQSAAQDRPILFSSSRDGNPEIYRMNEDGTGQTRLTNAAENDNSAKWSPDGKKIVWLKNIPTPQNRQVWVMDANGENQTLISGALAVQLHYGWSPDGTRILFGVRAGGGTVQLWTMKTDGSDKVQLTDPPAGIEDHTAGWSRDGRKVVFGRCDPAADFVCDVWTVNADGTAATNLTPNHTGDDDGARFTPDGRIVFARLTSNYGVYVMNADGTDQVALTSLPPGIDALPGEISPDGTNMLARQVAVGNPSNEILRVSLFSDSVINLTNNSVLDLNGFWSPDGTKIAFQSARDAATGEIYVMDADGSNVVRLTSDTTADTMNDWYRPNVVFETKEIQVTFGDVSQPGRITVTPIDPTGTGLTIPEGYTIPSDIEGYEITTDAVIAPGSPIEVCFKTPTSMPPQRFERLRVLHGEGTNLVDRTSSSDPSTGKVCGRTTSLSPFVVAEFDPSDSTAPTSQAVPSALPNAAGWNNGDLNVSLSATDEVDGSGVKEITYSAVGAQTIAPTTVAGSAVSLAITAEGVTTISYFATDQSGNIESAKSITIKLDKSAPTISVAAPIAGSYLLNQAVTVSYNCADGGSGVSDCTGTIPSGGQLDTASVGAKSFTVTATDLAGNVAAPTSVNYSVKFGIQALFDQTKAHKAGSAVPIKIRLVDAVGSNVSSAGLPVHAVSVIQVSSQASTALDDAGSSNPDFDFRYDPSLGGYIFNLKTTGYGTGAYLLNFAAGGGTYSVGFQVRQ